MELLRNQLVFKHGLNSDHLINTLEEGNPSLPRTIEDSDYVSLDNIINASAPRLFPKVLKNLETDTGTKMRKINKRQCEYIHDIFSASDYSKCASNSNAFAFGGGRRFRQAEDEEMEET